MSYNILDILSFSQSQQQNFFNSLANLDTSTSQVILDQVDWTNDASAMIEKVTGSSATSICIDSKVRSLYSQLQTSSLYTAL